MERRLPDDHPLRPRGHVLVRPMLWLVACAAAAVHVQAAAAEDAPSGACRPPRTYPGMDWVYARDNPPLPCPVEGGLFEPMDWSVVRPQERLHFDPVDQALLASLLAAPLREGAPRCVAAVYAGPQADLRPFMLHLYGRFGGGNSLVNINGALRSGGALPTGGDPGLFSVFVQNFRPVRALSQWDREVRTNPPPAGLFLKFMTAERIGSTVRCRTSRNRCRVYKAEVQLQWHQGATRRPSTRDERTGIYTTVQEPGDAPPRTAPAQPGSMQVWVEDPCWGTRGGFVQAYANRFRLKEQWNHLAR